MVLLLTGLSKTQRNKLFKPVLPALVRISEAFPPLVDEIVPLLTHLARVCKSQASLASYLDAHLNWGSDIDVEDTEELIEQVERTFSDILDKTVLKSDVYG